MAMDKPDIASAIQRVGQGALAGQTQTLDKPSAFNLRATLQVEVAQTQQRLTLLQEAISLMERAPDTARLLELMNALGMRHY